MYFAIVGRWSLSNFQHFFLPQIPLFFVFYDFVSSSPGRPAGSPTRYEPRFGGNVMMGLFGNNNEQLPERRGVVSGFFKSLGKTEYGSRAVRRGRRLGRSTRKRFSCLFLTIATSFLLYLAVFGLKVNFYDIIGDSTSVSEVQEHLVSRDQRPPTSKHRRKQHFPCDVEFAESVAYLVEPGGFMNVTQFSLEFIEHEEKESETDLYMPRFGGHQTLEEREISFYATNQKLHCGFIKGPPGYPSTGFDLDEKDVAYMKTCKVAVSSCIFGSSDFLRRPTSKQISEYSKKNVCFVMFVDKQTLSKLSSEGNIPDDKGYIGLWKIVVVRNLPYEDMRRTGKVPKFLSHRLFPSARYSIWLDSKMRLQVDPMLIIEYFLWRKKSEYAISNHYDRHCVWEEVQQNKRLNKYNHTAIDEQFAFYQSDGLVKFDPSDISSGLPSYVPEGSFIVRAHTPMSNLFSCLWFNEVDRFTSRDQLSFAYTYLKLRRTNQGTPFNLNMFKVLFCV
ncbi:probable hexosyltransferase MUCI70 isoform X3 [Cucumis melo]|uniref:Probable hexosyltransferase MUCI70 isoform X3 n=1 Tax=Cucumis melo TaxID=3656 RepID=A0ABM3KVM1_CUCME|nr:probable hexosyltransferase MUCI70 isoform X3 [Cucumis melo]